VTTSHLLDGKPELTRVDVADGGAMAQLVRPDLVRYSGLVRGGRPVPGWAVGIASLAPVALALLLVGSCQIATGAGLTAVRMPARILLILTGLSTLGIAATPEPATGPTSRHLAFAVSCVVTTAVWPVLVARSGPAQVLGVHRRDPQPARAGSRCHLYVGYLLTTGRISWLG
jgi:hypothetical protein